MFEHRIQSVGRSAVGLIYAKHVTDLQEPGLHRLDFVSTFGRHDQHDRVDHPRDIQFGLTDSERFDKKDVKSGGVEYVGGGLGLCTETATRAARGCAANEHSFTVSASKPDPVA